MPYILTAPSLLHTRDTSLSNENLTGNRQILPQSEYITSFWYKSRLKAVKSTRTVTTAQMDSASIYSASLACLEHNYHSMNHTIVNTRKLLFIHEYT